MKNTKRDEKSFGRFFPILDLHTLKLLLNHAEWCDFPDIHITGVKFYPQTHCVIFCNNPFLNGGSINLKKREWAGGE